MTAAAAINPGRLKVELARHGARLGAGVRDHPDLGGQPAALEAATRGIELVLPEDVWVTMRAAADSPCEVRAEGDAFVVEGGGGRSEVRIVPPPRFYAQTTRGGLPMWRVGRTYGGYLAIDPSRGPEAPIAVADVVETVRAAFAEGAVEFIYLCVGAAPGEGAGVEFLEPYVRAIKRHFDTLIAVQLDPPAHNTWIDRTYAMGVDALSYAVEVHDAGRLSAHRRGRTLAVDRDRTYAALGHAASIFPSGTVWSDLLLGVEPPASTIAGIDALVALGVLPVLSLFRPLADPAATPPPDAEGLEAVGAHLFRAVRDARINMHWVRDLSFAVTPIEARLFAGDEGRIGVGLGQFYRSRLGAMAARNLSRLRRRLRVRQVGDSFDSSHL